MQPDKASEQSLIPVPEEYLHQPQVIAIRPPLAQAAESGNGDWKCSVGQPPADADVEDDDHGNGVTECAGGRILNSPAASKISRFSPRNHGFSLV
jgi:hypothetical protein